MSVQVWTPALGHLDIARAYWPLVRDRAGTDIQWTIGIDAPPSWEGTPVFSAEEQHLLIELARQYADRVVVSKRHQGVGRNMDRIRKAAHGTGAHIKLDGDILPSPGFAQGFLATEEAWQDGALGWIVALKYAHITRWDVGPRPMRPYHRLPGGLSYVTDLGATAHSSYAGPRPINSTDRSTHQVMTAAGLWVTYTHRVWIDGHDWQPPESPYLHWKRQFLGHSEHLLPGGTSPARTRYDTQE